MNANELADCLDMRVIYGLPLKEAATMLRQQKAEIDVLKKELYFKDYYEELPDTPVDLLRKAQE